jgi:subtilisin family serine protease
MPEFNFVKKLDPRLRRLTTISRDDPARLRMDRKSAFISAPGQPIDAPASAHSKRVLVQRADDQNGADAPPQEWHRISDGLYTVETPITKLEDLANRPEVKFVESGRRMSVSLDTSVPAATVNVVHDPPPVGPGLHGAGVVVGIVDIGFDFTLDDFIGPDGTTRIAFLWDQSLTALAGESAPRDFGYGVEYTADDINAARSATDPFARVRHKPPAAAHGTHVMGIATGNGSSSDTTFPAGKYVGVADRATLIVVQPGLEAGLHTFADSAHVADAVDYIFRRADKLGKPCVINMSLGQNGGSHDGESIVERAIDRLLEKVGRAFVVAAGNETIWRTHAAGTLTPNEVRALKWIVGAPPTGFPAAPHGASDRTPNEMEIWYSSRDVLGVRVIDPAGNATPVIKPDAAGMFSLGTEDIYIDSERFTTLNGDARIYIEMSSKSPTLRSGDWQVELTAVEIHKGRFDAWIERDDRDVSNGFVDQSSFDSNDFDPSMTLGTPATARRAIAVANYDHRLTSPSDSSGRGPTRDGRNKPECAAPGTAILSSCALGGRSVEGSVSPVRVAMTGTSMAAPHVTGLVALLFEQAQALPKPLLLSAEQTRKLVTASASPPAGVAVFDDAWGFGRLDAETAFRVLATLQAAPALV